jgi:hypothetical protein
VVIYHQQFKTYTGNNPQLVAQAIQEDIKNADLGWYIKQMGILQTGNAIAAWALWEQTDRHA